MVEAEDVAWAYRLFLCREPDHLHVDALRNANGDRASLRDAFVGSGEFNQYLSERGFFKTPIVSCVNTAKEPFFVPPQLLSRLGTYVAGNPFREAARVLAALLVEGDVVVDVGASIGWFSLLARRFIGASGKAYAFEPHSDTFEALTRTVAAQQASDVVICSRLALGAQNSFVRIGVPVDADGRGARCEALGSERVPICALDSFTFRRHLRVLKISANGHELEVIRGASRTIREHAPILVIGRQYREDVADLLPGMAYRAVGDAPDIDDFVWLRHGDG